MAIREDDTGFGGLVLLQDTETFSYGVDAVLLADHCKALPGESVLDLGSGNGAVALIVLGKYGVASVTGIEVQERMTRLARETVEQYVSIRKRYDVPEWATAEMTDHRAGVFVSIHKDGRLRGCIGTILPVYGSVAEEIIHNAISASTRDPRFDPIRPDELDKLEINVDVLTTPEKIESKDELDVKRYGVIVSSGGKRGLLLPDLDGVDTVEEQVDIAMRKGGISPREKITLERFEVIRHR